MKRLLDLMFILLPSPLLIPLFFIIYLISLLKIGRPVFFKQSRPGLNGNIFNIYKFRTMSLEYDNGGELLKDDLRLNRFGRLFRSSSLDELPALLNVLKGEMSLVGPRPLLVEYLPLYSRKQARRHLVKPGITGWAQVNGRNSISWEKKFDLDVWYVENQSTWLDIKILWLTVKKVVKREGITQDGCATVGSFKGNNERK